MTGPDPDRPWTDADWQAFCARTDLVGSAARLVVDSLPVSGPLRHRRMPPTNPRRAPDFTVLEMADDTGVLAYAKQAHGPGAAAFLGSERAGLQAAADRLSGLPDVTVPRLLAEDTQARLLLLAPVPGRALMAGLSDPATPPEQRARWLRLAGAALAAYHDGGRDTAAPLQMAQQLPPALPDVPDPARAAALLDWARRFARAHDGARVRQADLHGDLNLLNLRADGPRLGLLDFGMARRGARMMDVAQCLVRIGQIAAPRAPGDDIVFAAADLVPFREGYGWNSLDTVAFRGMVARVLLRDLRSAPPPHWQAALAGMVDRLLALPPEA